jgi:tetratricopeptide (TPR) repeat protein
LRRGARASLAAAAALALAPGAAAELHVWVDESGQTHVTDDPSTIPPKRRATASSDAVELRGLWDEGITGPPVETPPGVSGGEADRTVRTLRTAVEDLGRGETSRASALLAEVLRAEPNRPEAHWYLALLDWQRGRLDSAETHLRAFLASSGDRFGSWRASAEQKLARLADERKLLAPSEGALRLVAYDGEHFRVQLDAALQAAGSPGFAGQVLGYLEEARIAGQDRLGVTPAEATGVVLYGRASYLRAYRHRFSFQTVGFFDGRIHVVSAAHPAGELRSLLFHEYTHALFREAAASDRPFWLNEGLAELAERRSRGMPALSRSERTRLRVSAESGAWIPLRRIAASFGGLTDDEARLAYLEATAAAEWIDARTDRATRARLLALLGAGKTDDDALRATIGRDTNGLDAALRAALAAESAS